MCLSLTDPLMTNCTKIIVTYFPLSRFPSSHFKSVKKKGKKIRNKNNRKKNFCHVQDSSSLKQNFRFLRHPLFSCFVRVLLWIIQWVILITHVLFIRLPNLFHTKIQTSKVLTGIFPTLVFVNKEETWNPIWPCIIILRKYDCEFAISHFIPFLFRIFTLNVRKKKILCSCIFTMYVPKQNTILISREHENLPK